MIDINKKYQPFIHYLYHQHNDDPPTDQYNQLQLNTSSPLFPSFTNVNEFFLHQSQHSLQSQFQAPINIIPIIKSYIPNFDLLCHQHHLDPNQLPVIFIFSVEEFIFFVTIGNDYYNVFEDSQQLIQVSELPYTDPFTGQQLFLWMIHP